MKSSGKRSSGEEFTSNRNEVSVKLQEPQEQRQTAQPARAATSGSDSAGDAVGLPPISPSSNKARRGSMRSRGNSLRRSNQSLHNPHGHSCSGHSVVMSSCPVIPQNDGTRDGWTEYVVISTKEIAHLSDTFRTTPAHVHDVAIAAEGDRELMVAILQSELEDREQRGELSSFPSFTRRDRGNIPRLLFGSKYTVRRLMNILALPASWEADVIQALNSAEGDAQLALSELTRKIEKANGIPSARVSHDGEALLEEQVKELQSFIKRLDTTLEVTKAQALRNEFPEREMKDIEDALLLTDGDLGQARLYLQQVPSQRATRKGIDKIIAPPAANVFTKRERRRPSRRCSTVSVSNLPLDNEDNGQNVKTTGTHTGGETTTTTITTSKSTTTAVPAAANTTTNNNHNNIDPTTTSAAISGAPKTPIPCPPSSAKSISSARGADARSGRLSVSQPRSDSKGRSAATAPLSETSTTSNTERTTRSASVREVSVQSQFNGTTLPSSPSYIGKELKRGNLAALNVRDDDDDDDDVDPLSPKCIAAIASALNRSSESSKFEDLNTSLEPSPLSDGASKSCSPVHVGPPLPSSTIKSGPPAPTGLPPPPPPSSTTIKSGPPAPTGLPPPPPPPSSTTIKSGPPAPTGLPPPPPPPSSTTIKSGPPAPTGLPPPPPPPVAIGGKGAPPPPPLPAIGGKGAPPPPPPPPPPPSAKAKSGATQPGPTRNIPIEAIRNVAKNSAFEAYNAVVLPEKCRQELIVEFKRVEAKAVAAAAPKKSTDVIMDSNRERNVGIVLQFLRLPIQTIEASVRTFDELTLGEEHISGLVKIIPTSEDLQLIERWMQRNPNVKTSQLHQLSLPARFFLMTMKVDHYADRLHCWNFMNEFRGRIEDLELKLERALEGVTAALESPHLPRMLQFVLALSNVLNTGSRFQEAKGFPISQLLHIIDFPTTNNKRVLLEILVEIIDQQDPSVHKCTEELLPAVEGACNFDVPGVAQEVKAFRARLQKCGSLVRAIPDENQWAVKLGRFIRNALPALERVEALMCELNAKVELMPEYFCEKPGSFSMNDTLRCLATFAKRYSAKRDLYEQVKREELMKAQAKAEEEEARLNGGGNKQESSKNSANAKGNADDNGQKGLKGTPSFILPHDRKEQQKQEENGHPNGRPVSASSRSNGIVQSSALKGSSGGKERNATNKFKNNGIASPPVRATSQ
ncbi:Formin [Trypanosoma melophagium]|uniref:Formin n=1 Tax=Trypanosoma melophagium TaxID=715481 RepID=UPI00351A3737|nr:Formin [Trypanosoma melophagium]